MWLLRGLSFTCKALQNSQTNKTQELSAAFTTAYEATLGKFHTFFIRPVFAVSYIFFLASFFPLLSFPLPRLNEGGTEIYSHLWIYRNLFFSWLNSGCRVFDVADAV